MRPATSRLICNPEHIAASNCHRLRTDRNKPDTISRIREGEPRFVLTHKLARTNPLVDYGHVRWNPEHDRKACHAAQPATIIGAEGGARVSATAEPKRELVSGWQIVCANPWIGHSNQHEGDEPEASEQPR